MRTSQVAPGDMKAAKDVRGMTVAATQRDSQTVWGSRGGNAEKASAACDHGPTFISQQRRCKKQRTARSVSHESILVVWSHPYARGERHFRIFEQYLELNVAQTASISYKTQRCLPQIFLFIYQIWIDFHTTAKQTSKSGIHRIVKVIHLLKI